MFSRARNAAIQLLDDYSISDPNEILIEDLIYAEDGIFEEKPMKGADGRIIFGKKYAIISVNSKIQNKNKRRFIIAHEIGHLKLHRHLERFFNCDGKAFLEWHKKGSHESEANQFAAELLMPAELFKREALKSNFNVDQLLDLSKVFNTSITSTAIRYTDLGNFPIAIVYSQSGKIKWYSRNRNFIGKFFKVNEDVPENSAAYRFFKTGKVPDTPSLVLANVWFKDFKLGADQYFYERCLSIPSQNAVLSFLWVCDDF